MKSNLNKPIRVYLKKFISKSINDKGMITIESIIIFPITLIIILTFFSYLFLEFEKSNIILNSNAICLDVFSNKDTSIKDSEFLNISIHENIITRNITLKNQIILTSDYVPSFASVKISYRNKSSNYKKFNVLILKSSIFEFIKDEKEGGDI